MYDLVAFDLTFDFVELAQIESNDCSEKYTSDD